MKIMLKVSVFIPFCNYQHDLTNLETCLKSIAEQTQLPHQVFLLDDSVPEERSIVVGLGLACLPREIDFRYLEFPFVNYAPAFALKFNTAYEKCTGDAICILCSNWKLGPNWIQRMAQWLEELGPGNVISSDNARKSMGDAEGKLYDFFAERPTIFQETNFMLIDEGFLTMIHKESWLPWDEDFDPAVDDMSEDKGNWHGVSEWGYRLLIHGVKLWIRRDLEAWHQPRGNREKWISQTRNSEAILRSKTG